MVNKAQFVLGVSAICLLANTGFVLADGDDDDRFEHRQGKRQQLPTAVADADYYDEGQPNPAKVELGRVLFFDKILSGNQNISCVTCHHPLTGTGDELSLPVGEGGRGLGPTRDTGTGADAIVERVPRNAPAIFNLGAKEFTVMFHDGRVTVDETHPSGFLSPAGDDLPVGLDNPLAVQAMFPVTSGAEMAGQAGENSIADAAAAGNLAGPGGVWAQLADRLRSNPEYVELFKAAYSEVSDPEDITYVQAANAIAAFEATAGRADDSPFDRYLRGERGALSSSARKGMKLFYGEAGCADCHSGTFQTDHGFYAIAMPQIGPGKGDGFDGHEDFGRERVSADSEDRYRFRTPTLRNVAVTGPWGHAGAYDSLRAVIEHHLDPVDALLDYDVEQAVLPLAPGVEETDFVVHDSDRIFDIAAANELEARELDEREIDHLVDFLHALTDPGSLNLRNMVPRSVPSGLTLAD